MSKQIFVPDPWTTLTNEILTAHIPPGSRVVDLGCGDASLLEKLRDQHQCDVLGVELNEDAFVRAIERGVPVIQADLNGELLELPSHSFDYAVLSQTLQQITRPRELLNVIFRIAKRALVVVPNFAHWRVRMQVALQGRAPVTHHLPYAWYESPNVHFLSMRDFRELAEQGNFRIVEELPIIGDRAVRKAVFANFRAHNALYVLERADRAEEQRSTGAEEQVAIESKLAT